MEKDMIFAGKARYQCHEDKCCEVEYRDYTGEVSYTWVLLPV